MRYFVGDKANSLWGASERGTIITAQPSPLIQRTSKVFARGRGLAWEGRKAWGAGGIQVLPRYNELEIDSKKQIVARLHDDDAIAHYDTFVILQEIKDALADRELGENDMVEIFGKSK